MKKSHDSQRIDFLGCPLDLLTPKDLLDEARAALRGEQRLRLEGLNVAKLVDARSTPALMSVLEDAERVHIDGAGISLGLKLLELSTPPRRAGIDLLVDLCALAADTGASIYLLGARSEMVQLTAKNLQQRYPNLKIAGTRDGYYGETQEAEIVEAVRASGADILFIGMSSPRKELLLQKHWHHLGVKIGMGVGGSFDVLSGKLPRAPRWMQVIGMEWFFRMMMEPRRLLWRYVRTNTVFLVLLIFARIRLMRQRRIESRENA